MTLTIATISLSLNPPYKIKVPSPSPSSGLQVCPPSQFLLPFHPNSEALSPEAADQATQHPHLRNQHRKFILCFHVRLMQSHITLHKPCHSLLPIYQFCSYQIPIPTHLSHNYFLTSTLTIAYSNPPILRNQYEIPNKNVVNTGKLQIP